MPGPKHPIKDAIEKTVRVSGDLEKMIEELAQEAGMTWSQWARIELTKAAKREWAIREAALGDGRRG